MNDARTTLSEEATSDPVAEGRFTHTELTLALRRPHRIVDFVLGRPDRLARNLVEDAGIPLLALVLLVGSGLMIRSFQALRQVNPGFQNPEEVLTLRLTIPGAEIGDDVDDAVLVHVLVDHPLEEALGVLGTGKLLLEVVQPEARVDALKKDAPHLYGGETECTS